MRRVLLALAVLGLALAVALWLWPGPPPAPSPAAAAPRAAEPSPDPASATAAGGRLAGRVLRDGQPVAGARVSLKGATLRVADSGPGGAFEFADVGAGTAYLSAADAASASEVLGPLEVASGSTALDLVLTLAPAVTVEGVVVDLIGRQPVARAEVTTAAGVAATDAAGRFRLSGARGPSWVEVSAPGYLARSAWVSLELARAGGRLEVVLTPASRLQGAVLEAGAPVAGATVWAERLEGGARGERSASGFTARDGTFSVEGPAGLVRLWAVTPRGSRITGPVLRLAVGETRAGLVLDGGEPAPAVGVVSRGGQPLSGAQVLALAVATEALAGTATSGLDGRFAFPALLTGRYLVQVQRGELSAQAGPFDHRGDGRTWEVALAGGQVLEGRVEPRSPGVRVRWRSGAWAGQPVEALTDGEGRFRFEGLPDELLSLEAEGPAGSATARARPGQEVVLTLKGGVVVVHLQDDTGAPVTDGVLLARSLEGGATRRQPVLAPDGVVRLELPHGAWELTLEAAGRGRSATARFTVGPSPLEVRLSLESSVPVEGVVRDAESQLPLTGVEVSASSGPDTSPWRVAVVSDRRGAFALPPVPRSATLRTHHPQYLPRSRAAAEGSRWEVALTRAPHAMPGPPAFQFEGIGMVLDGRSGAVKVAQVNEGGPAERAGVQVADALLAVDGVPTAGAPLEQTVGRVRGPAGTPVVLQLERLGQRFEVTVRRRLLTL